MPFMRVDGSGTTGPAEREAGAARDQLLEHHARLEARERGAEAEVLAEAEGEVPVGVGAA